MAEENNNDRKGILSAVDSPMRFAALIVLVVEAILGILLAKSNPNDTLTYVSMMVGILLITIIMAFIIEYKKEQSKGSIRVPEIGKVESQKKSFEWDVFLAAPMAGIDSEEDFQLAMMKIEELLTALEKECNYKRVYFAGKGMKTKKDFDNAALSIKDDTDAIKGSRIFILVYTKKIVSSVLFEAGISLAYGKPSFYFGNDFPFLMTQANNIFNHVKIFEADSIDDVIKTVCKHKQTLFAISNES
jgi:hypothetical protein